MWLTLHTSCVAALEPSRRTTAQHVDVCCCLRHGDSLPARKQPSNAGQVSLGSQSNRAASPFADVDNSVAITHGNGGFGGGGSGFGRLFGGALRAGTDPMTGFIGTSCGSDGVIALCTRLAIVTGIDKGAVTIVESAPCAFFLLTLFTDQDFVWQVLTDGRASSFELENEPSDDPHAAAPLCRPHPGRV